MTEDFYHYDVWLSTPPPEEPETRTRIRCERGHVWYQDHPLRCLSCRIEDVITQAATA